MPPEKTLSPDAARAYYDRFGARQDAQGFYEDPALDALVARGAFERADAVFELGCGTARLAARLLDGVLPAHAHYLGTDTSATMLRLARDRLAPWRQRARVEEAGPEPTVPAGDAAFDRFVSTYVLDLLPDAAIARALAEAHRVLVPGGLLCLASITPGIGPLSRLVMAVWAAVARRRPAWVGGCRPIELAARLAPERWNVEHRSVVTPWGVSSEVVVARRT